MKLIDCLRQKETGHTSHVRCPHFAIIDNVEGGTGNVVRNGIETKVRSSVVAA